MDPVVVTFAVLIAAVALFITNLVPPPVTAALVALTLLLTGTLSFDQAMSGFADPILVYLASLFIVSEALDATGVTAWAGQALLRRTGTKPRAVIGALMILCALFTAFISVDGAVAALVPVGVMLASRIAQPPSKVMIPLAFAAHAASMLTLLGTPINVIVSDLAVGAGARSFGFLEFALVGVPLLAGTVLITLTVGPKVLPSAVAVSTAKDLSGHAEALAAAYAVATDQTRLSSRRGVTEVVIPPRSELIGAAVYPGMSTDHERLVVVGVQRAGRPLPTETVLAAGDVVLVRGGWADLDRRAEHPGVVVVDRPDAIRRQAIQLGPRSYVALGALALMCVLLVGGFVQPTVAVLIAAVILVGSRVLSVEQAQRSVSLPTLVVVAGMIPLSTAIQTSGASEIIAAWLLRVFGGGSPRLLLLGIVLVVVVLGQFTSNLATVLIVAPIAISVAQETGVSVLPMLMGIAVAAAAAFLTPIANTANLMVQGAGGYRFGDYWKLGLPLLVFFVLVATVLVPIIWPF